MVDLEPTTFLPVETKIGNYLADIALEATLGEVFLYGEHFPLSHIALTSLLSPKTLWVQGNIYELEVTILINLGSTHNILQPRVDEFFGLAVVDHTPFSVIVGNGEFIQCIICCLNVQVTMGG